MVAGAQERAVSGREVGAGLVCRGRWPPFAPRAWEDMRFRCTRWAVAWGGRQGG